MAHSFHRAPAAIQARLTLLRERRKELNQLIQAMERYVKYLSPDLPSVEEETPCPETKLKRHIAGRRAAA
jgi:hypothetical protein